MSCSFTLEYYSTPDGRMDNENPVAVVLWLISVNFRMFTTITPTMWRTCLSLVLNSIVLLRNKKRPSHFSAYTGKHLANRLKNSSVTIYTKKREVYFWNQIPFPTSSLVWLHGLRTGQRSVSLVRAQHVRSNRAVSDRTTDMPSLHGWCSHPDDVELHQKKHPAIKAGFINLWSCRCLKKKKNAMEWILNRHQWFTICRRNGV